MLTTNDELWAAKLRLLRTHGMEPRYYHQVVGINSRLDTLQAAILNVKLRHLETWTDKRRENAERYGTLFAEHGLLDHLALPQVAHGCRHVWNQYIIRVAENHRDPLRKFLADHQIGTEIYYPLALHQQACFASLGYKAGSLPETERAARETVALPIFPELRVDEQQRVVAQIAAYFAAAAKSGHPLPRPKFLGQSQESRASRT
jgi:dTDP-4-amino-4,6-dideoxygalactose transaminase